MSEETARAWVRILRDLLLVLGGLFILIHETVSSGPPDPVLIAAGVGLMGVPPVLRLDRSREETDDDGKRK